MSAANGMVLMHYDIGCLHIPGISCMCGPYLISESEAEAFGFVSDRVMRPVRTVSNEASTEG